MLCAAQDCEDPRKLLNNQRVRQSPLFWVLKEIFNQTMKPFELSEAQIYPFICRMKIQVKTILGLSPAQCYKSLIQLQDYPSRVDVQYDSS
jgi:hypothetical protein